MAKSLSEKNIHFFAGKLSSKLGIKLIFHDLGLIFHKVALLLPPLPFYI